MGVEKNANYKVHNGTDFDEINFKTIASQVKMASGLDLESGLINSKETNGYTKLPNGLILQWGRYSVASLNAAIYYDIFYPITFPNKILSAMISISAHDSNGNAQGVNHRMDTSRLTQIQLKLRAATDITYTNVIVFWVAIGY